MATATKVNVDFDKKAILVSFNGQAPLKHKTFLKHHGFKYNTKQKCWKKSGEKREYTHISNCLKNKKLDVKKK